MHYVLFLKIRSWSFNLKLLDALTSSGSGRLIPATIPITKRCRKSPPFRRKHPRHLYSCRISSVMQGVTISPKPAPTALIVRNLEASPRKARPMLLELISIGNMNPKPGGNKMLQNSINLDIDQQEVNRP